MANIERGDTVDGPGFGRGVVDRVEGGGVYVKSRSSTGVGTSLFVALLKDVQLVKKRNDDGEGQA